MAVAPSVRLAALTLYRNLFRRIALLPVSKRDSALAQLRSTFRAHVGVADAVEAARLVQQGNSHLSYLRMVTPTPRAEHGASSGRFVFRNGMLLEGSASTEGGARHSAYDASNLDPEAVARHRYLVERQHFGHRR